MRTILQSKDELANYPVEFYSIEVFVRQSQRNSNVKKIGLAQKQGSEAGFVLVHAGYHA